MEVTEDTSDGYHTFKELYEFRLLYNAALFNEWAKQGLYGVHKSTKHFDGEDCFGGGWFIVMAQLPFGQISNHYVLEDWDLFKCEVRERGNEWDGHTAQDVANRLRATLKDTKRVDHRHCTPTSSPCGHEGAHRCCLCGEDLSGKE